MLSTADEAAAPARSNRSVSDQARPSSQRLDLLLVVALTRPAKAILEHVMADEPRKPLRALPCAVGQDPGDRELGVVIDDRVRRPTEEGEGRDVPVKKRLQRLGRVRL